MLELSFLRSNLELVAEKLSHRGMDAGPLLKSFTAIDVRRREAITRVETLKSERNKLSEEVGRRKRSGDDALELMEETRRLKETIESFEAEAGVAEAELIAVLESIPNLPHESVPVGKSEADNVEVRRWGTLPEFSFAPKPHWELGEQLGILDFERASKISGARFAVYWADGARLERALANFMLDLHSQQHGYTEVLPPYLVNSKALYGTGQLPKFADDLFKCEQGDYWLIPTAEVPLTNLFADEVLEESRLPVSLTAYTPCFRSEAGSYGKDVRGIIRQHQFQKVELVKFVQPERSYEEHQTLTQHAEAVLKKLQLPYRVMNLCTADLGFSAAKTYDLEVWLPGQGVYREISSCSNFEAFQARRANIRMKGKGKSEFLHTLNGSALAVGRTWLAVLENYQNEDGTVRIPEALVPWMGGQTVLQKFEQ